MVNEKLTNLETIELTIGHIDMSGVSHSKTVCFKRVKRLDIDAFNKHEEFLPEYIPLEFDQLEEMNIKARNAIKGIWIKFIKKQYKLRILSILWKDNPMSLQDWTSIIGSVPQLEVIKTHWKSWKNGDYGITGIMRAETNLKKVILFGLDREEYNIFRNIIDPEWQTEGNVEEVTFIRGTYN